MKKLMALMTMLLALSAPKAVQAFDGLGLFDGCGCNWYVSGFGAASFAETKKHHHHSSSSGSNLNQNFNQHESNKLKTGYFFSGAIGTRLDCFRVELEGGYHHNSKKKHHRHSSSSSSSSSSGNNENNGSSSSSNNIVCGNNSSNSKGEAKTWSVLVNFLYDFETCWCVKPFLGAGIGWASTERKHHRCHLSSSSTGCEGGCDNGNCGSSSSSSSRHHHKKDKDGFAWQIIAGVAYPLCDGWDLSLQYRYFNPAEKTKIHNHDVGVGLAYTF